MSQNLENFTKLQKFQIDNLVDFEKCCKTHIFLQRSASIQPQTSNILPKNFQKIATTSPPPARSSPRPTASSRRAAARTSSRAGTGRRTAKLAKLIKISRISRISKFSILQFWNVLQNIAIFWRARSRLYQNEILQENMRSTAFFKLYKICMLSHRCNLKILAKTRFEKSAILVKFQQNFVDVVQSAKFCRISKTSVR